jgi:hypothetical protein
MTTVRWLDGRGRGRRRRRPPVPACLLALAVALLLAGCGGRDDGAAHGTGDRAAIEHIHGLGIDPADGRLVIATHHGLFEVREGDTTPRRVGEGDQDVMGFFVVGPGHFLGSGHPGSDRSLPSNLGLIESRDGGRTWQSVALSGEADFHALAASKALVYGFDATEGRLMVSADHGRGWEERGAPAAVFGMAIDPADPRTVIAGTEAGIYRSSDAAATWRPLRQDTTGLLAWSGPGRLFLVDGQGRVHRSRDGGVTWSARGATGGAPTAFAADGSDLVVALADGTVKVSGDGGASWTPRIGA